MRNYRDLFLQLLLELELGIPRSTSRLRCQNGSHREGTLFLVLPSRQCASANLPSPLACSYLRDENFIHHIGVWRILCRNSQVLLYLEVRGQRVDLS